MTYCKDLCLIPSSNSGYFSCDKALSLTNCTQGCQHPDFSLRSQTFCYTADSSTTFLYMHILKTKTFLHIHHKTTNKPLEFNKFDSVLQKEFCDFRLKMGKSPPLSWLFLCLGRPMACGGASIKLFARSPNFFKTQCWQP